MKTPQRLIEDYKLVVDFLEWLDYPTQTKEVKAIEYFNHLEHEVTYETEGGEKLKPMKCKILFG